MAITSAAHGNDVIVTVLSPYDPRVAQPAAGDNLLLHWCSYMARIGFAVTVITWDTRPINLHSQDQYSVVRLTERPPASTTLSRLLEGAGPPRWVRRTLLGRPFLDLISGADVVESHWPGTLGLVAPLARELRGGRHVHVAHDIRSEALSSQIIQGSRLRDRAVAALKLLRVFPQEIRAYRKLDAAVILRSQERVILRKRLFARQDIKILQLAAASPTWRGRTEPRSLQVPLTGPLRLGFVGDLSRWENVHSIRRFIKDSWPGIRGIEPTATLTLFGRIDGRVAAEFELVDGIICAGWVDSLADAYMCIDVVLAPLRIRGGLKFKVAEARSFGKFVVGSEVANSGFEGDPAVITAPRASAWGHKISQLRGQTPRTYEYASQLEQYSAQLAAYYGASTDSSESEF